jgi:hypothetical protein
VADQVVTLRAVLLHGSSPDAEFAYAKDWLRMEKLSYFWVPA